MVRRPCADAHENHTTQWCCGRHPPEKKLLPPHPPATWLCEALPAIPTRGFIMPESMWSRANVRAVSDDRRGCGAGDPAADRLEPACRARQPIMARAFIPLSSTFEQRGVPGSLHTAGSIGKKRLRRARGERLAPDVLASIGLIWGTVRVCGSGGPGGSCRESIAGFRWRRPPHHPRFPCSRCYLRGRPRRGARVSRPNHPVALQSSARRQPAVGSQRSRPELCEARQKAHAFAPSAHERQGRLFHNE